MEAIKSINDFKSYLSDNRKKIYSMAEKAEDISVNDEWMKEDEWDKLYEQGEKANMKKYEIGEVWWTQFPFEEINDTKRRPAIIIDDDTIAVLTMMVSSVEKDNPYSVEIDDWMEAGLSKKSWARIDRIIHMDEWRMEKKIGNLSQHDLSKFMQLIPEYFDGKFHEFSLVAVINPKGKFLQVYDDRWKCWLFPYIRSADSNKENVDNGVSELLQLTVETKYVTSAVHCKYSISDQVYKIYKHKLYKLTIDKVPDYMTGDSFALDGKQYSWKSIAELEEDTDAMKNNDDIIAFVKTKCI